MSTKTAPTTSTVAVEKIVPRHVGIIPDGNRRWGRENNVPKFEAHKRGYDVLMQVATLALERGVQYLTAWGFSTENWDREPSEVKYLMDLFYWAATKEVEKLHAKNVKMRFLGNREGLEPKLIKAIELAEAKTARNTGGTFALALNYGGQVEISDAFKRMLADGIKPNEVTPEKISGYMYASDIPPLDLVIRTSGEQRTSGFMLWRSTYTELYFTKKHWPDFTVADLDSALAEYANRERRFGK